MKKEPLKLIWREFLIREFLFEKGKVAEDPDLLHWLLLKTLIPRRWRRGRKMLKRTVELVAGDWLYAS